MSIPNETKVLAPTTLSVGCEYTQPEFELKLSTSMYKLILVAFTAFNSSIVPSIISVSVIVSRFV